MITLSINIQIAESIEKAPNYGNDYTAIRMDRAIIVKNGTEGGRSSIDLQCTDAKGNKYLIMTTARLLKNLSIMVGEEG